MHTLDQLDFWMDVRGPSAAGIHGRATIATQLPHPKKRRCRYSSSVVPVHYFIVDSEHDGHYCCRRHEFLEQSQHD